MFWPLGEILMSSYRNILIWIGIVALIGVILPVVAFETGVLFSSKPPEDRQTVYENTSADGPETELNEEPENTPIPSENNEDRKIKKVTVVVRILRSWLKTVQKICSL
jgi:FtsZ-interacting cell division protein ZipA